MSLRWVWLQLAIGWLPVWALYSTLIITSHPGTGIAGAGLRGAWAIGVAALLGIGVWRMTERLPWPQPFRWRFLASHVGWAAAYATTFAALAYVLEPALLLIQMHLTPAPATVGRHILLLSADWFPRFGVLGVWFYVMVAGVAYATRGTERAARAEALAAQAQLAALRAQLHPHFLFNALHAVIHLIPREPARAAVAAEQLAGLLRTTIEEDRELVSLSEEWDFVRRYLDLERMRFGDRLQVEARLEDEALGQAVPAYAVQTLVENAVRHGVAPKVAPATITVTARATGDLLTVEVSDTGVGCPPEAFTRSSGTGLVHLRERLSALFGDRAHLKLETTPGGGVTATLVVPQPAAE